MTIGDAIAYLDKLSPSILEPHMKNSITTLCTTILLLSSSAVFAEVWVLSAERKRCDEVCKEKNLSPVGLGTIAGYEKSFVCRAEMSVSDDAGRRAGWTTDKKNDIGCAIAGGETANAGRISPRFDCLCLSDKD
jgi:hypothetical protein